jgi:hypothetical protein
MKLSNLLFTLSFIRESDAVERGAVAYPEVSSSA